MPHGYEDLKIHPPLPQQKDFPVETIGDGFIVKDCRLVAYRKAGFNPVAIASRTKSKAEQIAQRHRISKAHDTPEQVLNDPGIEVLDIALPPMRQLAFIKAAVWAITRAESKIHISPEFEPFRLSPLISHLVLSTPARAKPRN